MNLDLISRNNYFQYHVFGIKRPNQISDFNREYTRIKYQKVPQYYTPHVNPQSGTGVLDIDWVLDVGKELSDWYNTNSVLIQLNEELRRLSPVSIFNYLLHKTRGNANKFLTALPAEEMARLPAEGLLVADWLYSILVREFGGWKDTPESKIAFSKNQLWKIINLRICNMCYLDNFICEFEDLYYKIDRRDRDSNKLDELFYNKLPEGVASTVSAIFQNAVATGKVYNTLGGRITTLKLWMQEECNKKVAKREAQISLCCSNLKEKVGKNQLWKIINLRICNMCYLDNFICEFQELYYKIDPIDRVSNKLDELFYNKLPERVASTVSAIFQNAVATGKVVNTLGGRITTLKLWIQEECNKKVARREAQISLCCSNLKEKVGTYGCNDRKRNKKKFVSKRKKLRKIPFRRYKKEFRKGNGKFFRKKKPYPSKQKTCPTGKKTCTCWLCHEKGHYANECPKKDSKPKAQALNVIFSMGYEPIESDLDSDYSDAIYEYCTETSSDEEDTW